MLEFMMLVMAKELFANGITNAKTATTERRQTRHKENEEVNSIEIALLVMWLLITIRNKAALLPLFILLIDIFLINIFDTDFPRYCVTSLIYFEAAKLNIHIPSKLRYAFLCFGSLYWVSALDEMLYNHVDTYQGQFYSVMPYLVIALNAYIAAILLSDGGRTFVGLFGRLRGSVNNRFTWL